MSDPLVKPAPTIYPDAKWEPLHDHSAPGHFWQRDLIVLHITQGSTATGAIATMAASVHPKRESSHFLIDRDGTVIQLVDLEETAWHASQVNSHSVGIEHVAWTVGPLLATEAQYAASAKLIAWLCGRMKIPCNRAHIKTHNEASVVDGHTLCCTGALDPDRVVEEAKALIPPDPPAVPA